MQGLGCCFTGWAHCQVCSTYFPGPPGQLEATTPIFTLLLWTAKLLLTIDSGPIYSNLFSLIHSNITELATLQVASDKLLPVGQQRPKEWDCHVLSRRLVFTLKRRELNSNFQKNVRQKQMITLTISHIPNPSICFHLHSAHNSVGRKGDREWCATMNSRTK